MGHQFVKADWNRFRPTKAVNKNQYGFTQYPSARDSRTKNPRSFGDNVQRSWHNLLFN